MINYKRVNLVCGHYGSGKTNISVNMAFELKKQRQKTVIADLDIVNPYFRTVDSQEELKKAGIDIVASAYANTNLDAPAIPPEIYSITDELDTNFIVDVGGDDRGALVLGRISEAISKENNYQMFMVINCYRPLTKSVTDLLEIQKEIEYAGRIKFTGIINNSNLGKMTTPEDVLASLDYAKEASEKMNLPVLGTSYEKRFDEYLKDKVPYPFAMTLQRMVIDI